MQIREILDLIDELFDDQIFEIMEDAEVGNWKVLASKAYNKGLKKYQNDQKVMENLDRLLKFISEHDTPPPINSYPPDLNIHVIKVAKTFKNALWGHLKGQNVGIAFSLDNDSKELKLINMGGHKKVLGGR